MSINPPGQLSGTFLRHPEHGIFYDVAVVRDIVAGENGKRRQAAFATAVKGFDQDPRRGMRLGRVFQIVQDAGIVHIQLAGRRIDAIAFFRDGEGDNRNLRFAKFLNNGSQRIEFGVQTFMYRADNNSLVPLRTFLQHGKEMILRAQLAHQHITAEEANFTNTPVASFFIEHPVC